MATRVVHLLENSPEVREHRNLGRYLPTFLVDNSPWASHIAAKSLQSCPTLCDPIDGSPPGSPVPGILQAIKLEWVAISFSHCYTHLFKDSCAVIALEDEYYCLEWRAWLVQSLWIHLASEKTMLPSEQKAGMLIGYYVSNLLISGLLLSKTIYLFFFFFIAYGNWGEGNGNPLLCSCLGNLMGRGSWRDTVHGVAKSWTWLSNSVHGDWRIGNWCKNF